MDSALKNRNLQLYFSGQIISLIGTWMQQMALSWLLYRLTNSPLMLGVIGFTSQAPSLVLSPFAGIISDRTNRHKMIIATQILAMLQAALLTALVWSGQTQLWELIALSALAGVIMAFDIPVRQGFLVDMLENGEQMTQAIGINASINTMTRLIGPFCAGLLVAWAGEKTCFLINALSYVAVIIALLFVKSHQKPASKAHKAPLKALKEGFDYTRKFEPIRNLISLLALIGLFAMPFTILMPAFARDIFHGDSVTLGLLTGSAGAGSMLGALLLTSRKNPQTLPALINFGAIICGIALIVLGMSQTLWLALPAAVVVGFGNMVALSGSNTIIQTVVDADKRGRVMSFFVMAFMGTAPFGCMVAGAVANLIGPGNTAALSGIFTLLTGLAFASRIGRIRVVPPATADLDAQINGPQINIGDNSRQKLSV